MQLCEFRKIFPKKNPPENIPLGKSPWTPPPRNAPRNTPLEMETPYGSIKDCRLTCANIDTRSNLRAVAFNTL